VIARRAIFRRYAVVLATALVGGLLAYAALELAFATRAQVERTRELHVSEARAVAGRIAFFFEEIERSLVAIGSLPWGAGLPDADRMTEYQGAMRRLPAMREVVLADPGGAELLFASRSDPSRVGSGAVVDRDLAARARPGAATFGPVRLGGAGQAPSVQMAVRDRGAPARVTLATVDLQFVSDELARMPRRGGESAYMLDATGRLVSDADVSRPLQRSGEPHAMHATTLAMPHGSAWTRDADGRVVLAVWHRSERLPWTIVVESPWREALGPVMENLYRALAFIALALVLAIAASRHLADRMARPVLTLKAGADAFGRGDLGHRIEVHTGDELEELATDFNRMAAQLQGYTSGLEHLVEERTASLHEAMRARALFLAAASHDLRQPLYAITILADTLALHPLPPEAADALAKQRAALTVLRGLFDNLLDLSRFESGEIRANPRRIALREALLPLALEYEVVCRAKGLAWRCELPDLVVATDPELLRRLAGNLLSNAVRYTERGEVRLAARREGDRAIVEVCDTGVGIPQEHQARVFDEFVQLDNPGRGRDRGVGLGLSIVRKVDALLDARLRLRSVPGEGTTLTFELPLAAGETARETEPSESASGSLEGLRVWIVEDDPLVRDALAAQFAAWGADPAFAASRAEVEALHRGDGRWPGAAIVDAMLGDERGLEIARWLATNMEARRILLVTGNLEAQAGEALRQSGFLFLHKPLSSMVIAQWLHDAAAAAVAETRSA
jgi:signal transduction histidine kinase/ActR/RegA family two-component response regulator